jgi:CRP-like cAMP-binding protein
MPKSQSPNILLQSLPPSAFAALQPKIKLIDLSFGEVVAEPGQTVERVYFPHSGVISLVVQMAEGHMIETALVGNDGVVNGMAALDGKISLYKGIVQIAGSASVIAPDILRSIASKYEPVRSLLLRHEQSLFAQAQQSAACNASHSVEARICRWLLRMRDLAQSDDLKLTQEFVAEMLGVRRTSVCLVASTLQHAGLIKYSRGNLHILNVEGLRSASCECYEKVRQHYVRLWAK